MQVRQVLPVGVQFSLCQTAPTSRGTGTLLQVPQGSRVCCGPLIRLRCSDCPVNGKEKNIFLGHLQARDAFPCAFRLHQKKKTFFSLEATQKDPHPTSTITIDPLGTVLLHCTAEPTNPPSTSPFGQDPSFPYPTLRDGSLSSAPEVFSSSTLVQKKLAFHPSQQPFSSSFTHPPSPISPSRLLLLAILQDFSIRDPSLTSRTCLLVTTSRVSFGSCL
ncbi:hypothetical protein QBC32DRAFT_56804 [Pseudoneurospora amorphoporcata]|uniref:Uncharacterized protein n=1 Tax=Pseudoneurospora amorphoporcata TaxID=241081 RepID=A0AAN6P739_9PEZI|nr:hypothetical protein QBC32DRAFT_56804 [Pseudoneurospora amorphoporcata]